MGVEGCFGCGRGVVFWVWAWCSVLGVGVEG